MDKKSEHMGSRLSEIDRLASPHVGAPIAEFGQLVDVSVIPAQERPVGLRFHAAALRHAVFLKQPDWQDRAVMVPMAQSNAKPIIVNVNATKAFPPPPFKVKSGPLAGGRVEWIDKANDVAFVVDASGQERLVPTHRLRAAQE